MRKTIKEMLQTVMQTGKAAILAAAVAASAALPSLGDDSAFARGASAAGRLDLHTGTRIATEGEVIPIAYSPRWGNAASCTIELGGSRSVATSEGETAWTPSGTGGHTLTHTAGDLTYTAQFAVLGDEVAVHAGTLGTSGTWGTGKTHLITASLAIPSGVALAIEPGAVVKFMPGTSLTVESGASCTANGVIFTHINDDTVGGDTLYDGDSAAPKMGDYTITGSVTDDDSTEYRYMPPQTLASSISYDTRLRGYRTYIVSNSVTVASGATLTLQPGTILKFNTGCSLTVNGTLDAQGTRAAPIVFTSLKDDAHGGDANGDGDKTYAQAGDWHQITGNGTVKLNYCEVLWCSAQNNQGALYPNGGTWQFDNSIVAHCEYDCMRSYGGTFTANNSVFMDSSMGAAPSSGTARFVNCVFNSLTTAVRWGNGTFYNCIFSEITEDILDKKFYSSTLNCKFYNCCFWNPEGTGDHASAKVGQNGCLYADPLFVPTVEGISRIAEKFHIAENSPCINAGDAANAPELDYYGQPRNGAPDIGIYEVQGDAGTGYDLAATAVNAQAARSTIGDTIEVSYDVANVGLLAVADPWHDALYLVSSSSGKQYALGEPLNPGGLGAGETRTFTSQFALPVIPEGQYRLRFVVNSRRMDVPEGAATENNALVSEGEIEVVADSIDAANGASGSVAAGASGSVAAGASGVCAFTLPSGSGDRLMRVTSSAGGATLSARCGVGFLPVNADAGTALSFSGGAAWISVPAGTEKVWLVLDNDGTAAAPYEVEFIDGSLTLSGISPASIPSSGNVTVEIAGAGFTDECEVSFTGAGTVAPLSVKRVSQGLLAATVDAAAFASGKTYSVAVKKGTETKTLQDVLSVAAAPGKPKFWAKLDVPSSMRQGRLVETCFIEYGNSGTADMLSPVLQVSMTGDGTLGYIGGLSGLKTLQFVAAGDAGSAGVLRPGSSHRIRFAIRAGASNKISLHTSKGSDYAPAPWTNAADYLADLSAAATRIDLRGQDATDYVKVFDLAKAVKNGEPTSAIYGRVVDENGEGVGNVVVLFTNATSSVRCMADDSGAFLSDALDVGEYFVSVEGANPETSKVVSIAEQERDAYTSVGIGAGGSISVMLPGDVGTEGMMFSVVLLGEGVIDCVKSVDNTGVVFRGLPAGIYRVTAETNGNRYTATVSLPSKKSSVVATLVRDGEAYVAGILDGQFDSAGDVVVLLGAGGIKAAIVKEDGTFAFESVPAGCWVLGVAGTSADKYEVQIVEVESGGKIKDVVVSAEAKAYRSAKLMIASKDDSDPHKLWWWQVRGEAWKLYEEAAALLGTKVPRPPASAMCSHNMAIYRADGAKIEAWGRRIVAYLVAYGKTDGWLVVANTSKLVGSASAFVFHRIADGLPSGELINAGFDRASDFFEDYFNHNDGVGASFTRSQLGNVVKLYECMDRLVKMDWSKIGSAAEVRQVLQDVMDVYDEAEKLTRNGALAAAWADVLPLQTYIDFTKALDTLGKIKEYLQLALDIYDVGASSIGYFTGINAMKDEMVAMQKDIAEYRRTISSFGAYHNPCPDAEQPPMDTPPVDSTTPSVPKSCDPNEMVGEEGVGEARYVKPGQELTYTIYFENKAGFDIADAQEVKVTNPLSEWLDWSTFEMREVAFNNQCDVNLDGLANGTSEVQMNGTNKYVRTTVECDAGNGVVTWYMRVYDPHGDSEGYPLDGSGFLPSNDDTHRGDGHITYRIKVRDDAPAIVKIVNSATIVFDYNDPIETDPSWWNTVGTFHEVSLEIDGVTTNLTLIAGQPFGALPAPKTTRTGYTFDAWYTGPNGTGIKATSTAIVPTGDFSLYQNWVGVPYKVRFNANGGTGTMADQAFVYGTAQKLSVNAFKQGMYAFVGWATRPDGEVVYADGQLVENLTASANGVVTLYAVWTMDRPMLFTDVTEAAPQTAASVYDGYLYNKSTGALAGTIQVKVGKPGKDGKAAVKATVIGLDGKKKSLKAAEKGKATIESDGTTTVELVGGDACEVKIGAKGMSGTYGSYDIDGALNVFTSKDAADKATAATVLGKWQGVVNVAWRSDATERLAGDGSPYHTLSVTIANKGKAKVAGTLADGTKVSARSQLLVGDEWCCVPVLEPKKSHLAFVLWLPADATGRVPPMVVGLENAIVGKPGTLKAGAEFRMNEVLGDAKYADYLPNGVPVTGGAKWVLPKAGKVQLAKDGLVDVAKLLENPSALKLTYTAKTGSFKGSFKAYSDVRGKPKGVTVNVTGVLVDGIGYGAATIKKIGSVPVTISDR